MIYVIYLHIVGNKKYKFAPLVYISEPSLKWVHMQDSQGCSFSKASFQVSMSIPIFGGFFHGPPSCLGVSHAFPHLHQELLDADDVAATLSFYNDICATQASIAGSVKVAFDLGMRGIEVESMEFLWYFIKSWFKTKAPWTCQTNLEDTTFLFCCYRPM